MSASSPSPSSSPSLVPPPLAAPQLPVPLAPLQSQPDPSANTPPPLSSTASSPPPQSPPPPASTSTPPPQSPPPASASPPPSQSSPPAATSPPLPSLPIPPPSPPSAPPPTSPPAVPPPSPPVLSPPPPVQASPPVSASPPPPTSTSSPPSANRPPPSSPSPPPPAPRAVSPSPPNAPPPPVAVPPPTPAKSPPHPAAKPTENSPPPPALPSPAPSGPRLAPPPSPNSPPIPSPPPPRNQPQPVLPPTPTPPSNSSAVGTPPAPPVPSPITPGPGNATQITPAPSKPTNNTTDTVAVGNASSSKNNGIHTTAAVAIGLGAGFVVLCVVGLALWFVSRRKKRVAGFGGGGHMLPTSVSSSYNAESPYSKAPSSAPLVGNVPGVNQIPYSPPDPDGLGHSRSWFTYDELSEATDCFSEHNLLGEGGFGSVYKGCLPDGREVAVKQLKVGSGQGEREFRAEVEIISRVHHRHLVSLVGYCISDHQRLLVYEYVPNNTLHYHLHGQGRPVLDWATRRKVAAGAARGIAYLHEDCHPRIIHRDIKSSNILLDNNFDAKVSDFGLAKLALDSFTHVTTRVMGTFGYLAPEYASSGKLTEKSDVFSFGVVLLEFITGRKPVDASQPLGDESLVEWARPLLCHALDNGDFEGLVDPRLEKNYVENEMLRMIEAAAACVRHSAAKRPRMSQVVRALDGISDSGNLSNGLTPGQSELFVSAQSAEIRSFHRMAFGDQDFGTDVSQNSWRTEREL